MEALVTLNVKLYSCVDFAAASPAASFQVLGWNRLSEILCKPGNMVQYRQEDLGAVFDLKLWASFPLSVHSIQCCTIA